jgi:hypothetical protein
MTSKKSFKNLSEMRVSSLSLKETAQLKETGVLDFVQYKQSNGSTPMIRIGYGYSSFYDSTDESDHMDLCLIDMLNDRIKYSGCCDVVSPVRYDDREYDFREYSFQNGIKSKRIAAYLAKVLVDKYGMAIVYDGKSFMFEEFGYHREMILVGKSEVEKTKMLIMVADGRVLNIDHIISLRKHLVCTTRYEKTYNPLRKKVLDHKIIMATFVFGDLHDSACEKCSPNKVCPMHSDFVRQHYGVTNFFSCEQDAAEFFKDNVISRIAQYNKPAADSIELSLKVLV